MERVVDQLHVQGEYRKGHISLHHGEKDLCDIDRYTKFSTGLGVFLKSVLIGISNSCLTKT